jgi:hypothetical protein
MHGTVAARSYLVQLFPEKYEGTNCSMEVMSNMELTHPRSPHPRAWDPFK